VAFQEGLSTMDLSSSVSYYHGRYFGKVLESIFGVKGYTATGKYGISYNEKLHTLHSSPHIVRLFGSHKKRCQD
jgi:hypothetical protein